jgi:hypothetical protein
VTVPLSLPQLGAKRAAGIPTGNREGITPRGSYTVPQDGPAYVGTQGEFEWEFMPAALSGRTNFAADSTMTGSNLQTVEDSAMSKVGGGAAEAQPSPMGGTIY